MQNFTTSMEASFTAIARGITHADLNAELTLIMAHDETSRLWKKMFATHEQGTFINSDKPGRTYLEDHLEAQQKLRARHEKIKSLTPFEEKPYVCKPSQRRFLKAWWNSQGPTSTYQRENFTTFTIKPIQGSNGSSHAAFSSHGHANSYSSPYDSCCGG